MSLRDEILETPAAIEGAGLDLTGPEPEPASETVLSVDRWGRRRAADISTRWAGEIPGDEPVIADAHEALFSPRPTPASRPADPTRARWWGQLMETPEYRGLHRQTMLDPGLSELGAAELCRQWVAYEELQPERAPDEPGEGEGDGDGESIERELARIRSTSAALKGAREAVDDARETAAGLGLGDPQSLDPETLRGYWRRVRDDPTLRAILQMAGRMQALAAALQRTRTTHGRDDLVGVEMSGDLGRILPSELLQLACGVPELELLALCRVATRQAMSREYRGLEPQGKGPIVVSVDESGSMSGDRIVAAKALALAMAWVARHQRRTVVLAGFSAGPEATRYVSPPESPDALVGWLSHAWNGGTTLEAPLGTVPGWWTELSLPPGQVDHLVITDAEVDLPSYLEASYREWAETVGCRTYGIVIGARDPGPLSRVCQRVWAVPSLDLKTAALEEVLSV